VDAIAAGTGDKSPLWSINSEDEYHEGADRRQAVAAHAA
jgi:hypothetical protein